MSEKGWVILALLAGAVVFALQAGEYSTGQWLELSRKEQYGMLGKAEIELTVVR